jgi:hypothetical protein
MSDREEITYDEYIRAYVIVAIVEADRLWRIFQEKEAPLKLPTSDSMWLDSTAARRHVGFGATKFRELIKAGVLPKGTLIGGKLFWRRDELDKSMEKYFRKQRRTSGGSR